MEVLNAAAVLVSLAALFAYLNHRLLGLPTTIGLMLIALLVSLAAMILAHFGLIGFADLARRLVAHIDFSRALMHGMLSFLLFAGALHVDLSDLREQRWSVLSLATLGVLLSTALVGAFAWGTFRWLDLPVRPIDALLFGALISPTDPIAVLGTLRRAGAPRRLEVKIAGESLFNDGVGVVVFLILLGIATGGGSVSAAEVGRLFAEEAVGGLLFGLGAGSLAYAMLKGVDNYQVEVLITLALVMGGYALADALHLSGPIATVVAGLVIGNHGRGRAMSERTRRNLDTFWELLDDILNAVLFVLIGFELLVLTFRGEYLLAAAVLIPGVLLARFVSVGVSVALLRLRQRFVPHAVKVMTWSGLRGGISVALALSLPHSPARQPILAVTYAVVVFSLLVQGLTIGHLMRRIALLSGPDGESGPP